jgi:DNA-binding IclR family transcriptional regulator
VRIPPQGLPAAAAALRKAPERRAQAQMVKENGSSNGTAELTAPTDSASSLGKMLNILQLFSETAPVWSTADIIETLETSRSTGYRYIKTLHDAGLLNSSRNGYYTLGPGIIEMDLQIRLTDPLLLASHGVLEDLVDTIGHSALLCTAYHDSVLCVGEARAPQSPTNRFSRGQRRPLFQGAVSKVILAYLPHHRLKAIYPRQQNEIASSGLGSNWSEFRAALGQIKKDGYSLTKGEFNPGVYSVAAPVLTDQKTSLGSVGVAWDEKERRDVDVERAVLAVKQAAVTISERLLARQEADAASHAS